MNHELRSLAELHNKNKITYDRQKWIDKIEAMQSRRGVVYDSFERVCKTRLLKLVDTFDFRQASEVEREAWVERVRMNYVWRK